MESEGFLVDLGGSCLDLREFLGGLGFKEDFVRSFGRFERIIQLNKL